MTSKFTLAVAFIAAAFNAHAAHAQDAPATPAATEQVCELHVWPSENYIGINTGLLSGFGLVGALADQAAHDGRVRTVKELMNDYLGPEIQVAEMERSDLLQTLSLANYRIVIEDALPSYEENKDDPAIKAFLKGIDKKIDKGERLSDSTAECYAELVTTHIFYHKAMMYGSNLFTGYVFREFDGTRVLGTYKGQVKNPLELFPASDATAVEAARAELRQAYALNFVEFVDKKVKPKRVARRS